MISVLIETIKRYEFAFGMKHIAVFCFTMPFF